MDRSGTADSAYPAALEERAAHLERSREEEARRRVTEERLRIARDLHDSLAHSMATINVQAGVAAHVIDRHPGRARDALVVIQQASGEVLDELGALLGLLRLDERDGVALAPTPSPAQLGALVESAAHSGLHASDPPPWHRARSDAVVGPALDLMHDDAAHPWTVSALAAKVNVSRATFARRFTDLVGERPMAYLTCWRLCLAADLLRQTDATVDAIAHQVGYANAYALSVAFKREHGTRPTDHRRR